MRRKRARAPLTEAGEAEPSKRASKRASWNLKEGAAIAEGRTVMSQLGGGSRYEVYLVWDDGLFSLAVAKLLRPDRLNDERALRDLAAEAEILEATAHPVIVRGFDYVLDGLHPHLLIEHLEGPTLRALIRRGGPLELQQLLPLALHIVAALQYLSNQGLVHLDVKPDNIVMGVPPRLIDLSVARSLERAASTSSPVGTDAYMAPEQCDPASGGPVGSPADVWGWGATLFHAVTGRVPFPRASEARHSPDRSIRFPQLDQPPGSIAAGVPGELKELILSTMQRDPQARPGAAELADQLEPLVAELPRRISLSRRGK